MMLLTKAIKAKLLKNGAVNLAHRQRDGNTEDFMPAVKFFNPCGAGTWLFTELDEDGDTLFGLCDLGQGSPELGNASLSEIESVVLRFGLKIERDRWFRADWTLSEYADAARDACRIMA